MSTFVTVDVACPECSATQEIVVAAGINIARTPQARDAILAGTFQRVGCPACGETFTVVRPFTYLDWSRTQLFGVFPTSDRVCWEECEASVEGTFRRTMGEESEGIPVGLPDEMLVRTVFGLGALREKLLLFEAGFDDTVIEVLKLRWMLAQGAVQGPTPLIVDVVDGSLLVARAGDQVLTFTLDDYDQMRADPETLEPLSRHLVPHSFRDVERLLSGVGDTSKG